MSQITLCKSYENYENWDDGRFSSTEGEGATEQSEVNLKFALTENNYKIEHTLETAKKKKQNKIKQTNNKPTN